MDEVDFLSHPIFAKLSNTAYRELRYMILTGFVLGGLDRFVA